MKGSPDSHWSFLTNHTHVLVVLHKTPEARIRDMALEIGITERAVQRILADLVSEGYLKVTKSGRRNEYSIVGKKRLRHELEKRVQVGTLLESLAAPM